MSRLALLSYMVHVNNPQGAPSMFTQIRQERVTPRWRAGVWCNHHSQLGLRRKHTRKPNLIFIPSTSASPPSILNLIIDIFCFYLNIIFHFLTTSCMKLTFSYRHSFAVYAQEQITQSLLCISTTGYNDSERSVTKLEAPSFPIEYKIFCSTFNAKPYINSFRNDLSSI